jgi:hypothetical protein
MSQHPIEFARKALREAAMLETGHWRDLCVRLANALSPRGEQR